MEEILSANSAWMPEKEFYYMLFQNAYISLIIMIYLKLFKKIQMYESFFLPEDKWQELSRIQEGSFHIHEVSQLEDPVLVCGKINVGNCLGHHCLGRFHREVEETSLTLPSHPFVSYLGTI